MHVAGEPLHGRCANTRAGAWMPRLEAQQTKIFEAELANEFSTFPDSVIHRSRKGCHQRVISSDRTETLFSSPPVIEKLN